MKIVVVVVVCGLYVGRCNSAAPFKTNERHNVQTTTLRSTIDPEYQLYEANQWIMAHGKKYTEQCTRELSHLVRGRHGKSQKWEDVDLKLASQYFHYIQCNWACYMKKFVASKEYPKKYNRAMECNARYLKANKDLCAASYKMRQECTPLFGKDILYTHDHDDIND